MVFDNNPNDSDDLKIAIIGLAGTFPGANSVETYWENLCSGKESTTYFSDEELIESGVDPELIRDPNYIKAGQVLDDPGLFDASFFGYSPREAQIMDPQHRLFLECAWEAVEYAGYDANSYPGSIGVYGGALMNTYLLFSGLKENFFAEYLPILIGNHNDYLSTLVSYKLNLKGPSVTVQTACSTSLVAVHLACQSLLNGECDMALAGGVAVRVPHKIGYVYHEGSIFSPDGHCRPFDANARGTVFGSGVGIVVLKRLEDAITDRDHIHAVVLGSAINNDGSSKVSYTAPSVNRQSDVIIEALANAGIEAGSVSYVEAHGTGTSIGDPIEIAALTNAYRTSTEKKGFCAIGSVKANIGHLDNAAGVAGLIKTALALKHEKIPPSLFYEEPNPEIDFENSPFYVNTKLSDWSSNTSPRRAGVTSLGVGGTNAHVILEESPPFMDSEETRPWQLILLSAKTDSALDKMTYNFVDFLETTPEVNLADAAYTLQVGRQVFNHRRMLVCKDLPDGLSALNTLDSPRIITSVQEPENRDVVFMFSGQGSQYINMGLDLYQTQTVFRENIDLCTEILQTHLNLNLRDILYPGEDFNEEIENKIKQTFITQPALFTIEYSLAMLWESWGIKPSAMVGHSIGEYVAACLAKVFSLEDALSLVAARGQLMQELPPGSMVAVQLSEEEIKQYLDDFLSVAVINSPGLCVISGETSAIGELERRLSSDGIQLSRLHTSHAFHSKMMEPILGEFTEKIKIVHLNPPQIPFLSNVSGTWITSEEAVDRDYWAKHIRQTVRFSDCLRELSNEPNRIFLEVGPGNTLNSLAKQHIDRNRGQKSFSSIRHPKEEKSDVAFILSSLGHLWLSGVQIDWSGFYEHEIRYRFPLPTYPFERERYWLEEGQRHNSDDSAKPVSPKSPKASIFSRIIKRDQNKGGKLDDVQKDEVEQAIAEIFQEVLGVESVKYDDDFYDLGGSSLLAASLFTKIYQKFGRRLPLACLFDASTVRQLANLLREENQLDAWSTLVEIQPGNSQPKLFFFHAEEGNVIYYRDLSHALGPEYPFYGIQAQGLDGGKVPRYRMEEMATNYIEEIKKIQPQGPYFIGGFCYGGVIAFEVAQQLQAHEEEVDLVVMIQNRHNNYLQSSSQTTLLQRIINRVMDRSDYELSNMSKLGAKAIFTYLGERFRRILTIIEVDFSNIFDSFSENYDLDFPHSLDYTFGLISKAQDEAVRKYEPKPYKGNVIIFRASKQPRGIVPDPTLGWGEFIEGDIDLFEIPAYHQTIMSEPQANVMAEKLRIVLENTNK